MNPSRSRYQSDIRCRRFGQWGAECLAAVTLIDKGMSVCLELSVPYIRTVPLLTRDSNSEGDSLFHLREIPVYPTIRILTRITFELTIQSLFLINTFPTDKAASLLACSASIFKSYS